MISGASQDNDRGLEKDVIGNSKDSTWSETWAFSWLRCLSAVARVDTYCNCLLCSLPLRSLRECGDGGTDFRVPSREPKGKPMDLSYAGKTEV